MPLSSKRCCQKVFSPPDNILTRPPRITRKKCAIRLHISGQRRLPSNGPTSRTFHTTGRRWRGLRGPLPAPFRGPVSPEQDALRLVGEAWIRGLDGSAARHPPDEAPDVDLLGPPGHREAALGRAQVIVRTRPVLEPHPPQADLGGEGVQLFDGSVADHVAPPPRTVAPDLVDEYHASTRPGG